MFKFSYVVMALVGFGCSKGSDDRKVAYEKAAAAIDPVVKQLKGTHAAIMVAPPSAGGDDAETFVMTTLPKLAQRCHIMTKVLDKLSPLAAETESGPHAVGDAAKSFVRDVNAACDNISYAQAMDCWKPCATAWTHFEEAIVAYRQQATEEKVTTAALE